MSKWTENKNPEQAMRAPEPWKPEYVSWSELERENAKREIAKIRERFCASQPSPNEDAK